MSPLALFVLWLAVTVLVYRWMLRVVRGWRTAEAEFDAACDAWRQRQADRRRIQLVDADLVVFEAREADWQRVMSHRRTTRLDALSVPCTARRHSDCRPLEWSCDCRCHAVEVAS